jgi:hypothetical protein
MKTFIAIILICFFFSTTIFSEPPAPAPPPELPPVQWEEPPPPPEKSPETGINGPKLAIAVLAGSASFVLTVIASSKLFSGTENGAATAKADGI